MAAANSGINGPATAPPKPPEALQLKKQKCYDLFLYTFKRGQLYQSPLAFQAAIVDAAKQFHFSLRRQGYTFVFSREMRK